MKTPFSLTLAGKMTNYLFTFILLKMAERSEAKCAKRSFASTISYIRKFDAKLRFALLASLRSAISSAIKVVSLLVILPARVNFVSWNSLKIILINAQVKLLLTSTTLTRFFLSNHAALLASSRRAVSSRRVSVEKHRSFPTMHLDQHRSLWLLPNQKFSILRGPSSRPCCLFYGYDQVNYLFLGSLDK